MKKLLIHNDNTILAFTGNFKLEEQFVVNIDSDDIDIYFSKQLTSGKLGQKIMGCDVVLLKVALSNNYLEYLGIRLAYHIRLTPELGEKSKIPIILIAEETYQFLAITSELPEILFTGGIYLMKDNLEELTRIFNLANDEKITGLQNLNSFIDKTKITPPSNYQSHHSVSNEWSLLRWSKYIGCSNDISEVKNNIECGLYFKYLSVKNPLPTIIGQKQFLIQGKSKILLIDDEAEKGWAKFYECFFGYSPNIKFEFLSTNFSALTKNEIIEAAKKKVEEFDPEIVLLDLRLCEDDFLADNMPENFSGNKILKIIKDFNKGIQVIITTASNKIWNYQSTLELGSNGYIIKSMDSNENILMLIKLLIEQGANKSVKLKKLANGITKINAKIRESKEFDNKFSNSVQSNLDISFKLIEESFTTPKYINYAYLQLFLIAEEFLKQSNVFEEGDKSYVINGNVRYLVLKLKNGTDRNDGFLSAINMANGHYVIKRGTFMRKMIDTNLKMSSVLLFKYGFATSGEMNWTKIYTIRNQKAAHPEVGLVDFTELNILIEFLLYLFDENNYRPVDKSSALSEPSYEEQIEKLTEKYNKR